MTEQTNGTTSPAGTGQQPDETGKLLTQAEVNDLIGRLRAEVRESTRRQIAEQYGDLDTLKTAKQRLDELEAEKLTEADKLRKQVDDLKAQQEQATAKVREAELRAERLRVGLEMGLPPIMAERLAGDTAEAMKEDAQKLLDSLPASSRRVLPDTHATEGALATGNKGAVKLTAQQLAIIAKTPGMTEEKYIANMPK